MFKGSLGYGRFRMATSELFLLNFPLVSVRKMYILRLKGYVVYTLLF